MKSFLRKKSNLGRCHPIKLIRLRLIYSFWPLALWPFIGLAEAHLPDLPTFRHKQIPVPKALNTPALETFEAKIIKASDHQVQVRFQWSKNVGAAAWCQGNRVWIYFSRPGKYVDSGFKNFVSPLMKDVAVYESPQQTVVAVTTALGCPVTLKPHNTDWLLTLDKNDFSESSKSESMTLEITDTNLTIRNLEGERLDTWVDPEMVLSYQVMPFLKAAMYPQKQTGAFEFLKTLQGLAIQVYDDDLKGTFENKTFSLQADPVYGFLSSPTDRQQKRTVGRAERLLTFPDIKNDRIARLKQQQTLTHTLGVVPASQHLMQRFELAKFYLAIGRVVEAIGMLDLMALEDPNIQNNPGFLAYRGVAYILNLQPDRAIVFLDKPEFQDDPEINLWQGVARILNHDYDSGLKLMIPGMNDIQNYPLFLREVICFQGAYAAATVGYPGEIFLHYIDREALSQRQKDAYDLLKIRLSQDPRYIGKRLEYLTLLSKSLNPQVAAQARLLILEGQKSVTSGDETMLDDLRFLWRGDPTEMTILQKYVTVLLTLKKPVKALRIMRQINEYCKDYPGHKENLRQARQLFYKVFMAPTKQSPLKAIALYHELQELRPLGEPGDKMVLKLAEHYEALGLTDKAKHILSQHLDASTVTPGYIFDFHDALARLCVGQKDYQGALKHLDLLGDTGALIPERQHRLTLLRAKILVLQGKMDQALALLSDNSDLDMLALRADIFWAQQLWPKVRQIFDAMIGHPRCAKDEKPKYVLALAIVLNHMNDEKALKALRTTYESTMKQTPYESAFMLMTSPEIKAETYYREAVAELSESKIFGSFLSDFKEKSTK